MSFPALWILPGSRNAGNVSCIDYHFVGDKGDTCICSGTDSGNRGCRNLVGDTNRMVSGRYDRNCVLLDNVEEKRQFHLKRNCLFFLVQCVRILKITLLGTR